MKLRMTAQKNSVMIDTDTEVYPFIRRVVKGYCENNSISQNPFLSEKVSEISGEPGVNDYGNLDGLPTRSANNIEIFLRNARIEPQKVLSDLKRIIKSIEPSIEIIT
jgi:hypothetical protein